MINSNGVFGKLIIYYLVINKLVQVSKSGESSLKGFINRQITENRIPEYSGFWFL